MSNTADSWLAPSAPALTGAHAARIVSHLHNRGWCIAWVCSAAACVAGAALTRYPAAPFTVASSDGAGPPGMRESHSPGGEAAFARSAAGNEN